MLFFSSGGRLNNGVFLFDMFFQRLNTSSKHTLCSVAASLTRRWTTDTGPKIPSSSSFDFQGKTLFISTKSRAHSGDKKGGNILESLFSFLQIHTHTKQYFSFFCKLKVKAGGISSLSSLEMNFQLPPPFAAENMWEKPVSVLWKGGRKGKREGGKEWRHRWAIPV